MRNYSHFQKVFGCSYMGTLHIQSEKNIRNDQKVYITSMSRDQNQRTLRFRIVVSKRTNNCIIDNNFFINLFKHFMKKPTKNSQNFHIVVCNHFFADILGLFIHFLNNISLVDQSVAFHLLLFLFDSSILYLLYRFNYSIRIYY